MSDARVLAVSPFTATIEVDGSSTELWRVEVRDLARGFGGALLLALPLLYTLEMWTRARIIPSWDLALIVLGAYFANVGFSRLSGFKDTDARTAPWLDAVTSMAIGLVASIVTLLLVNLINFEMPLETTVKLVLLEMVPTSFGASLARNQLGARGAKSGSDLSPDARKLLGTVLGATMFSFNIAPTVETQLIGNGLTPFHQVALLIFSLLVSAMMVFVADYIDRDDDRGVLSGKVQETVFSYFVSIVVSALLLWMFGYIDFGTPLSAAIPWLVVMGYATTLGGAAGRIIL